MILGRFIVEFRSFVYKKLGRHNELIKDYELCNITWNQIDYKILLVIDTRDLH